MKRRPVGKEDYSSRSCLHDDITVVIVRFSGENGGAAALPAVVQGSTMSSQHSNLAALTAEVVQSAREVFDKLDR